MIFHESSQHPNIQLHKKMSLLDLSSQYEYVCKYVGTHVPAKFWYDRDNGYS